MVEKTNNNKPASPKPDNLDGIHDAVTASVRARHSQEEILGGVNKILNQRKSYVPKIDYLDGIHEEVEKRMADKYGNKEGGSEIGR